MRDNRSMELATKEALMDFKDLSPELKAKAEQCKTPEELLALASAEGYELSDEEIEQISGGLIWSDSCSRAAPLPFL